MCYKTSQTNNFVQVIHAIVVEYCKLPFQKLQSSTQLIATDPPNESLSIVFDFVMLEFGKQLVGHMAVDSISKHGAISWHLSRN